MGFSRLRILRKDEAIRDLMAQTKLSTDNLIMPYFVIDGKDRKEKIEPMPGVYRLSVDRLVEDIGEAKRSGIKTVLLFGICRKKNALGSEAYNRNGIVQKAVRAIKKNIREMIVITDVCLCGHTTHGHCGIVKGLGSRVEGRGYRIDNDATIKILAKIALSHAEAGTDFVAPSAMMDGQVCATREALDRKGYQDTGILGYSAKYASSFYGPFREAIGSAPKFGDRKSYQLDYRNSDEALREIAADIKEGADIIMVKPALAYLDVMQRAKQEFNTPIAAFNVSGEYAMVKAYCKSIVHSPWFIEKQLVLEILTSIKRAGADLIITYHAKEAARWLR